MSWFRFDDMFEAAGVDAAGVLAAAEANLRVRRAAETDLLRIAAGWADLHPEEWLPTVTDEDGQERTRRRLADEEPVQIGGDGTPKVIGFCPGELGLILETTYTGAKHLIADALDLIHRLPKLWATVQDGRVAAWKARRVAAATRTLTRAQAAQVDEAVHAVIATLGWARFELILDATLKRADPETAHTEEQAAATRRFVAVGRANDHHIMSLIARGTSLDILSFLATVNRIADILATNGDPDPVDVRRSKAIGILARPAKALELLADHQHPSTDSDDEDGEPDPEHNGHTSLQLQPRSPLGLSTRSCRCGPRIQLHVHLSQAALTGSDPAAVCRIDGIGPLTVATLRTWLGTTDTAITVRPVLTPDQPAADTYEIPPAMRQAVTAAAPRLGTTPGPKPSIGPLMLITPGPTCPPIAADRPVRPTSATSAHSPAANTATKPSATSTSDNPHPESSCGAADTAGSGWSPTPAPTPSADHPPPTPSGTPPHHDTTANQSSSTSSIPGRSRST